MAEYTPQQKAAIVSQVELTDYQYRGYSVQIISNPTMYGDNGVMVEVEASFNGQPVAVNNPIIIINPPLMASTDQMQEETDDSGDTFMSHVYEYNPEMALKQIIVETIITTS